MCLEIKNKEILRPCPFCGGKAELIVPRHKGRAIKCTYCCIRREKRVLKKTIEELENELVKDWNTRVLDKPVGARGICPECNYPTFKNNFEDFNRCEGCNWTSKPREVIYYSDL